MERSIGISAGHGMLWRLILNIIVREGFKKNSGPLYFLLHSTSCWMFLSLSPQIWALRDCPVSFLFPPCIASVLIKPLLNWSSSDLCIRLCMSWWYLLHTGLIDNTSSKALALYRATTYPSHAVALWLLNCLPVLSQDSCIVPCHCLRHVGHSLVT